MTFTFPNPADTTQFTADNGITYLWDDDSNGPGKWVVKSFLHEGVLVDLSPFPPTRPDRPDGPNDGDLWFDTSPEELTLYVYSEDSGAWIPAAPPTTLEGRVSEAEAIQIQIVQRLQANESLTNLHSAELLSIRDDFASVQNDITELEEEIDAIAPSVERGKWTFTAVGTVANPGQFTMYDADFGSGQPTGLFKSAKSIWFNEIDSDGTPHAFADVDDGELLEIFVDGSSEYGLYEVVGKAHDETQGASSFWVIDVNFIRTLETTTAIGPGELCRFKIFMAPTGGDASSFVLKTGDEMSGNLSIDKSEGSTDVAAALTLKGSRPSTTNSAATIAFENDQSTTLGYLDYRSYASSNWFTFNQDVDLSNHGLHSVSQIRMQSGGYIGSGSSQRLIIRSGGSNNNQAGTEIQRAGDGRRTFAIRGKAAGSSSTSDFFWAYGNSGSGGDAINYTGLTTQDNHIATKKYVDSKASSSPTYTITKSGGNYYVS